MTSLQFFPARIAIGEFTTIVGGRQQTVQVRMTPEFYRALSSVLQRIGGPSSDTPNVDEIFMEAVMATSHDDVPYAESATTVQAGAIPGDDPDLQVVQQQPLSGTQTTADTFQQPTLEKLPEVILQRPAHGSAAPLQAITVMPSPMTFVSDRRCAIHVSGAVSALTFTRTGTDLDMTGQATIEMNLGDALAIEYTATPTLTLIER